MRVLIITNAFPNSAEETRGIFTYQIVNALKKKGDVEIVAPLPWVPPFFKENFRRRYSHTDVPAKEKFGGMTVHHPRYGVIPKVLGFTHPVFMFGPLLRVSKRLDRKRRIDLINAHWVFPDGVAAAWVARKLRIPLVLTGLGCDINHYPSLPFRKGQIKKALIAADRITVKGHGLKQKLLQMGIQEHKVTVIPNGLDLNRFKILNKNEARRRLEIRGDGPFILFVGGLDPVKGVYYLIQALKGMADNLKNTPRLLIVGDGPQQKALLLQADQLGIANRISFVGKKPHAEIPLWMNAADVFCLPSIREGRPNVLLEALACGTPVVASNVGSVPEIVCEGNGRVAGATDTENLQHQLLVCLKKQWDRNAIRESAGRFTWDDCAELYIKVYQRILDDRVCSGTEKHLG